MNEQQYTPIKLLWNSKNHQAMLLEDGGVALMGGAPGQEDAVGILVGRLNGRTVELIGGFAQPFIKRI